MSEQIKYLDYLGLTYYDSKIKSHIATKDEEIKVVNATSDTSLVIVPGSTSNGTTTNTTAKVNIDGSTIVFDANGKLSVASSALTQYVGEDAIEVSEPSNGEKTISLNIKSGDQILINDSNGLSATIKVQALSAAEISALSGGANVKEAYRLVGANDVAISGSEVIKVYKDSALKEVYLGSDTDTIDASTGVVTKNAAADAQSLNFAYQLVDGTYQLVKIDVSKFLTQSEFADGLQVVNGVVSVKKDATSENFLTVSTDGVKLSGVQDAIDEAAADSKTEIDTTVTGESASHMAITKDSTAADGHDKYSFELTDVASQDALEEEVTRAEAAEVAIDNVVGLTKGANNETRTYTNNGTYIGLVQTNTVASDIKALDTIVANIVSGDVSLNLITYSGAGNDIDALFA